MWTFRLVISKAPGSVTINNIPGSATVSGNFTPTFTKLGDGTASVASLTTSNCTVSGGVVSFVAAGTCSLQASVTAGTNYLAATGATQSFTIASGAYKFSGFFQPVENLPVLNVAKAGSAIPMKFSLNGNQGLNILAAGYPGSAPIACNAGAPSDALTETVNAGGSSLSYDATTGQYIYVWKTDKSWANTCRILVVRLSDGTDHMATFNFTK